MHFFIDHTKLTVQGPSHKRFGPNAANPTTEFDLSTEFLLTQEAKAFACQDGMMIVQRNNAHASTLVNLIIKPLVPTRINGITIRYYIYRGIKIGSFFTATGDINPYDPATNNEFIEAFWESRIGLPASTPTATPLNIGYGDNVLPPTDPNSLNGSRPIRDLFNNKAPAKPFQVMEGMWIGDFTTSTVIAFEIELESELGLTSTLNTYRSGGIMFSITGLTDEWEIRRKKELITTYIDPAAFFGMHAGLDGGVDTTTFTGGVRDESVPKTAASGLYTDILRKFANKNRIYLDIRSEKGLSYNFYDTYEISSGDGRNVVLNAADNATAGQLDTAAIEYSASANGWPILYFNSIVNYTADNGSRGHNKVNIRLRLNDNITPVLFIENNKFSHVEEDRRKNIFSGRGIKNPPPSVLQWTKNVGLYFPNAGTITAGDPTYSNISTWIKLHYFVGESIPLGGARLRNEKYYDSAFCTIDLESLGDGGVANGYAENSNPIYIKEPLQADGTGNFSLVARAGAYWNSQGILFYARMINKSSSSGKTYLNTYKRRLNFRNSGFNSDLRDDFYIIRRRYQTTGGNLDILGINSYHEGGAKDKEDLMLLGLSIMQMQAIKATASAELSLNHPKYIFLERDHEDHLTDTSLQHHRYYRYNVKVQGLDAGGTPHIATPIPAIQVYSRDNVFFTSTDFVPTEPITHGENRIEFRVYRDGAIYINDNIDLSLVRKKMVESLTEVNNLPVYTLVDDDAIPGDTSGVQGITYVYYDQDAIGVLTPPANPPEFCTLQVVMVDERIFNNPQGAEATASSGADFTALNYSEIFNYTNFNDNGIWVRRSYKHNVNGDILTRGQIDSQGTIGNRKYVKLARKAFMVFVEDTLVNASPTLINNRFQWEATVRYFARPDLFAVFLGAVREINDSVICQGFAFPDASSHPSALHVNGNAFDTNYLMDEGGNQADDETFIRALHKYGIGVFRIGPATTKAALRLALNPQQNSPTGICWKEGWALHNTHLHTEAIKIHR